MAAVDPELRVRFTSPHPKDFSDDVIDVRFLSYCGNVLLLLADYAWQHPSSRSWFPGPRKLRFEWMRGSSVIEVLVITCAEEWGPGPAFVSSPWAADSLLLSAGTSRVSSCIAE